MLAGVVNLRVYAGVRVVFGAADMSGEQEDLAILIIKNIDASATPKDLAKLLNFHSTSFLRKHTCVEIKDDEGDLYAKVVVPTSAVGDALKFDGVEYYGMKLIIQEDGKETEASSMDTRADESTDDAGDILCVRLDCRNHPELNFPPVKEFEVCDALNLEHSADPLKVVKAGWGRTIGTFEIQSDDIKSYIGTSLNIRGHEIELTPVRRAPPRSEDQFFHRQQRAFDPDAIKIRFFNAFDGASRILENSIFDEYFVNMGVEIVIPTQIERQRDRRDFNTNRYIVVKKVDAEGKSVDFGERITVGDKTFKISYPGQQRFCAFCRVKHGWDCPTKARHNFLRALRQGKTDTVKIYSDSNLRLTNQLALSSDVACMSGGGIGQLINVIPFDSPHKEVIISGGTNDLKAESLKEYVFSVEKMGGKLTKLASTTPVTIALPPLQTDIPDQHVRGKFLRDSVRNIENVEVVELHNIEVDDTQHPTEKGTEEVLKQIHAKKDIIMDECFEDVVSKQRYRGVQRLFKTGCRGCDDLTFTHFLCAKCKVDAASTDTTKLEEEIQKLMDELYPAMDVDEKGGSGEKRGLSDGNDDNDGNENNKRPALDAATES